jgi:hypothetical protein
VLSILLTHYQRSTGLRIDKLSPDYLDVSSSVYTWSEKIEAPAVLKHNSMYYMFGSHLSGWSPNDNVYSTARSLSGPWSPWRNFAPPGSKTFQSQTTYILPYSQDLVIYMGDRWIEKDLSRSTYVWLPLDINGTTVSMRSQEAWDIPRGTGLLRDWEFKAKDLGKLSNGAQILGNGAAGYIGGTSNGSVVVHTTIPNSRPSRNTWKIYYRNGDRNTRYASVQVGGQSAPQKLAFLATEGQIGISTITTSSDKAGDVVISGWKGAWGPDIVALKVPAER